MIALQDRQIGMLVGLAIGDAMGAPIEFTSGREPENYVRRYMSGGFHHVSKGEFTDDTSMALAMADAFIASDGFDPKLIMDNFLKWKNEGAYSPRGDMFDCGNTVYAALRKYEEDRSNPFVGDNCPQAAGNGGLMRLAPAILAASTERQAIHYAMETTRLTHGAEEALFYSKVLASELWNAASKSDDTKLHNDISRNRVMSGGYVKETYQAAWWAFNTTNCFEDCIITAINRGHDSDTTGAVAGMIAGCIYGYSAIPQWMRKGLQWHDYIVQTAKKLIAVGCRLTPREELEVTWKTLLNVKNPRPGEIYSVEGKKCLCIQTEANYGGGSLPLWAVEGHSAQLTLKQQNTGYLRGLCTKVSENPKGIIFKPNRKPWPEENKSYSEKFLPPNIIARYDTNWR